MRALARQIGVVQALGSRVVLVHGGGPQTDAFQRLLGEEPRMIDGRRVTSAHGPARAAHGDRRRAHGEFVAALSAEGAPAIGVSGASAGLLLAERRAPMQTSEGTVDFGEVGDLRSVDPRPLTALMDSGYVPVVCPPAGDGEGGFLNVNADLTAASLAVALGVGQAGPAHRRARRAQPTPTDPSLPALAPCRSEPSSTRLEGTARSLRGGHARQVRRPSAHALAGRCPARARGVRLATPRR